MTPTKKDPMNIVPRAMITGGTDGIGRATATALAKKGYRVDIVGRSPQRGAAALAALRKANPNVKHALHLVDLDYTNSILEFLASYRAEVDALDLLILNANEHPDKVRVGGSGIDRTFQVGAVSRFLFSVQLDPLLRKGHNARVVYLAAMHKQIAKKVRSLPYDQLGAPRYSIMASAWQCFAASGLMVHHLPRRLDSPVAHEVFDPGIVATRKMHERGWLLRGLVHLFSTVREPKEVGDALARHITTTSPDRVTGRYYQLEKETPPFASLAGAAIEFDRFVRFCAKVTGVGRELARA